MKIHPVGDKLLHADGWTDEWTDGEIRQNYQSPFTILQKRQKYVCKLIDVVS
jgi:hypothetical protein